MLACTLLAILSIDFAFYFVDERVSSEAKAELRRGLVDVGTPLEQHGATRTDHFTRLARVVAKRFEFVPSAIEVMQGKSVRIVVKSEDVFHGFGTTMGQIARGGTGNDDWHVGFHISRKFF